jgi:hypothetical protein
MPQVLPESFPRSKPKRRKDEREPRSTTPATEKSLDRRKEKPLTFGINRRDEEVEFATMPGLSARVAEEPAEKKSPRLVERVRNVMRLKHYSLRTERSYWNWIERFTP